MYQEILVLHVPQADKKAAPVLQHQDGQKNIGASEKPDTHIVPRARRGVNRIAAMLIGGALTAPYALALACAERGYFAFGGEVFIILLGAAVGGWLADHWRG